MATPSSAIKPVAIHAPSVPQIKVTAAPTRIAAVPSNLNNQSAKQAAALAARQNAANNAAAKQAANAQLKQTQLNAHLAAKAATQAATLATHTAAINRQQTAIQAKQQQVLAKQQTHLAAQAASQQAQLNVQSAKLASSQQYATLVANQRTQNATNKAILSSVPTSQAIITQATTDAQQAAAQIAAAYGTSAGSNILSGSGTFDAGGVGGSDTGIISPAAAAVNTATTGYYKYLYIAGAIVAVYLTFIEVKKHHHKK